MGRISSPEQERLAAVLDFWRMIEAFAPYDLSQHAEGRSPSGLPFPELEDDGKEISGFRLFVGIFDQTEIDRLSRGLHKAAVSEFEESERRQPSKAKSCFASFRLDAQGRLSWEDVAVSMTPWALGRLERRALHDLSFERFEAAREDLRLRLRNLETRIQARRKAGEEAAPPFSGEDLLDLHRELLDWAGFSPAPDAQGEAPPVALLEAALKAKGAAVSEEPAEPDILNSFYMGDVEAALRLVTSGRAPKALAAYLTPADPAARIDFYTEAGREALVEILRPRRLNRGRWLSNPGHAMSLMQQAAVNGALEGLRAQDGIFSVNGPPGTGKTTLLRDVIAEAIVARARVLAGLRRAEDAFDGTLTIHSGDQKTKSVARLREELAGFEMVVASSNNAAVENVSRDLPKADSLHAESRFFGEGIPAGEEGYLRSVARKLAAPESGAEGAAAAGEEVWGLVSCALGNKKNRQFFRDRVFWASKGPQPEGAPLAQSFWEWRKTYVGPSFAEAAAAFKAKEIGDPLQIEPVFTLSGELTAALAELSPHTKDGRWSPNQTSVQALADAANPIGAHVEQEADGDKIWIGSPLRVHRRCMDPMFGAANRIAYQDKMVFGGEDRLPKPQDKGRFWGESCWIDLGGTVSGRQSVAAQNAFMARLLLDARREAKGEWPPVYVISPFKEVAHQVKEAVARLAREGGEPLTAQDRKALNARIGTTHTFQGKEEKTVFMVLGADEAHKGAAAWAASKPNLLNVALTRAKQRFYMIGDLSLWRALPYFREAAAALPALTPEAFLARLQGREAPSSAPAPVEALAKRALDSFEEEAAPSEAEADRPELEGLRAILAAAVRSSETWEGLQDKLAASDLELAPRGGGLILREKASQAYLCKGSELGFGYSRLILKFQAGFPGHPHHWLPERVLGQGAARR